jgi:hypothetical protein
MLSRVSLRQGEFLRLVERKAIEEGVDKDNMRAVTHTRGGSNKGVLRWQRQLDREQWQF